MRPVLRPTAIKSIAPALLVLLFPLCLAAATPFDEQFQFIYFATLEGAHADGLTDAETDRILLRSGGKEGAYVHFVYACPLCMPVANGLCAYRTRPEWFSYKLPREQAEHRTMGAGLPVELRQQLASNDLATRLKAVNALVTRWVDRRMQSLNLTPEQRKDWERRLEDGRKEGMKMLDAFRQNGSLNVFAPGFADFKECAVCSAATKRGFMGAK